MQFNTDLDLPTHDSPALTNDLPTISYADLRAQDTNLQRLFTNLRRIMNELESMSYGAN